MEYFFVYIVECVDGTFYVGQTDNLERRIADHNAGIAARYTATRRPVRLLWSESFSTRDEAFVAERKIKNWSREKKKKLVSGRLLIKENSNLVGRQI